MPRAKKKKLTKPSRRPKTTVFYKRQWGAKEARYRTRLLHHWQKWRVEKPGYWWQERSIMQRIALVFTAIVVALVGSMYGIAQWYIFTQRHQPLQLGTTFIPAYARHFSLDPQETLHSIVYDLGIRHLRLVSYWDEMEPSPGVYNFAELDWQFRIAEDSRSKVSLAIGLRQPRWPECHMPTWAATMPMREWSIHLKAFMGKVIERYKTSPALQTYQLENEFFLKVFGICPDHSRERLVDEYDYVKLQDPDHPVIVSRSNNAIGLPLYAPRPDAFGISIYKRVWDKTLTKRYYEYPFPAWFYGFLAGAGKIATGKDMIIHELQAEAWLPEGYSMTNPADIPEQNKSLNAKRLRDRIKYGKATGMKTIDLWGAEWWYWRKVKANDASLWDVVKEEVQAVQDSNRYQ